MHSTVIVSIMLSKISSSYCLVWDRYPISVSMLPECYYCCAVSISMLDPKPVTQLGVAYVTEHMIKAPRFAF